MKKFFAIAGIAAGTIAIVAGIIALVRDGRAETPVTSVEDGLSRRMVEEGEKSVVHLQNAT